LGGLNNFPQSREAVEYTIRRLLQIVWCRPTSEIPNLNGPPSPGFDTNPYQRLIASHPQFDGVPDDDWIIGEVADRFDRFPPLIVWRKLYCEFLPPRDGRQPGDMEAV